MRDQHGLPVPVAARLAGTRMDTMAMEAGASPVPAIGYWSAMTACAAAAGYGVAQALQLLGVLRSPWDEILMFWYSMSLPLSFLLSMVALHHSVPLERRIWTHCALVLAALYAGLVILVHPTQLAVVIPARLVQDDAAASDLSLTTGTFIWAIDGAAYLLMGAATLFAAAGLAGNAEETWLRRLLLANGLIDPVILAVYLHPALLPVGALWLVTAPGSMWLLARFFWRRSQALDLHRT